ncbi:hypothetical protein ACP70R_049617 [Stipagrostis hirtigluma subsp. patula]
MGTTRARGVLRRPAGLRPSAGVLTAHLSSHLAAGLAGYALAERRHRGVRRRHPGPRHGRRGVDAAPRALLLLGCHGRRAVGHRHGRGRGDDDHLARRPGPRRLLRLLSLCTLFVQADGKDDGSPAAELDELSCKSGASQLMQLDEGSESEELDEREKMLLGKA